MEEINQTQSVFALFFFILCETSFLFTVISVVAVVFVYHIHNHRKIKEWTLDGLLKLCKINAKQMCFLLFMMVAFSPGVGENTFSHSVFYFVLQHSI